MADHYPEVMRESTCLSLITNWSRFDINLFQVDQGPQAKSLRNHTSDSSDAINLSKNIGATEIKTVGFEILFWIFIIYPGFSKL